MRRRFPLLASAVALTSASTAGLAQAEPVELGEIVVTAAGFEQNISDAPASISVISGEELAKKSYKSIVDAVNNIPGVYVTGGGGAQDISIRGMHDSYTLYLVDGRPVSANFDPKRPVFVGSDAGNSLAQVNHYALKSIDSFLVKADRGLPNHRDLQVGAEYFALRNFNDINDKALATDIPALDDPEILRLHRNACDWHQTRANEIRDTEAGIALTTALAMMGDSRLPDPAVIQGIHQSMWRVFGPKAQK